jgi:hypothetical protein
MSETHTIATHIRDPVALSAACRRLGLAGTVNDPVGDTQHSGKQWTVQRPGWVHPMRVDLSTGSIHCHLSDATPQNLEALSSLLQAYGAEKAIAAVQNHGHSMSRCVLPDGSTMITIKPGGRS